MSAEPALRAEDRRAWDAWMRTAAIHARTQQHRRAVDRARHVVEIALRQAPTWAVMWSGGKDSTVMTHLVTVDLGARVPVFSEKDDLDYPGELAYVRHLAAIWGLDLRVLEPPISPATWFAEHAHELDLGGDIHGRAAELSKRCFYDVVESASAPFNGQFIGLRAEESRARRADRAVHGPLYLRRSGQWRCTPLADWIGIDVYAYAESHGIELLDVYRCIAFMHSRTPWHLRKSWWVPGASGSHGGISWLRHYYPSLFERLRAWMPAASSLT